jgi:hypothetical protein
MSNDDVKISLNFEEQKANLTVVEHINYGTFELKASMARRLMYLFIGTNVFVALLVCFLAWLDWHMINIDQKYVGGRLIDRSVVMSLIGATTIQVGVIAISLFGSLFQKETKS